MVSCKLKTEVLIGRQGFCRPVWSPTRGIGGSPGDNGGRSVNDHRDPSGPQSSNHLKRDPHQAVIGIDDIMSVEQYGFTALRLVSAKSAEQKFLIVDHAVSPQFVNGNDLRCQAFFFGANQFAAAYVAQP